MLEVVKNSIYQSNGPGIDDDTILYTITIRNIGVMSARDIQILDTGDGCLNGVNDGGDDDNIENDEQFVDVTFQQHQGILLNIDFFIKILEKLL